MIVTQKADRVKRKSWAQCDSGLVLSAHCDMISYLQFSLGHTDED